MATYRLRNGSVHGVKHQRLGINNQDARATLVFGVPQWDRTYHVGLVSDGCTGIPAFSRSEVGSNLITVFCLARIQELVAGGLHMQEIPLPLYYSVVDFLRALANMVMPSSAHWPYPITFTDGNAFRNQLRPPRRFMTDYLAATILGFVDDGTTLVTFQAGDGVIVVNDEVLVADQNDRPDYPALSVSSSGGRFVTATYESAAVSRLALASDGIEEALKQPELDLPGALFPDSAGPNDLQFWLNRLRRDRDELMADDCTVVTRERFEE